MAFPVSARYFVSFRHTDTGLTPTFTIFKNAATLGNVTPPSISELASGIYYFDKTFTTLTDPELVFEVDGGAGLPADIRYQAGAINPGQYLHIDFADKIPRMLGMLHENSVLYDATYNLENKMLTGKTRIYDSKANADAAIAAIGGPGTYNTGKIAEYTITATYSGSTLSTYLVTKSP